MSDVALKTRTGDDYDGDTNELNLSKQLLDRELLRPVNNLFAAAKHYLRGVSTPAHRVFGPGAYLVPMALVSAVDDQLKGFERDIAASVDHLASAYPEAVERRRAKLGQLFRAEDYLTPAQVRGEFSMRWSYVSFAAPERLEGVDRALFESAKARYQEQLADAYTEVRAALREMALRVASDLAKRLEPSADGKRKAIRGTCLNDLAEFLSRFSLTNITDDDELAGVVKQLADVTGSVTPEALRHMPDVRERVLATARDAVDRLDSLVVTTAGRAFNLEGAL